MDRALDPESDALTGMGVNALLSKQYAQGHREFVEQLCDILERTMPSNVKIDRKGGLFKLKRVVRFTFSAEGRDFILEEANDDSFIVKIARVVGGIRLKTETVKMKDWLDELSETIRLSAESRQDALDALTELTGG